MINPTDMTSSIFNLQGKKLEQLSQVAAAKTPKEEEKLQKAARDFEAVFVNQFLEIMDSTIERTGEFSGGQGEQMFRSMLNQEIAQKISSTPQASFGFAKQIYEQMKNRVSS